MDYSLIAAKAAASSPQSATASPYNTARTLRIDGDGIAYYCAGNDETTIAEARSRTREKIDAFLRASGAGKQVILLTASGSDKGGRYAIASVKPYQGNRTASKKPRNWHALRDMLEQGEFGQVLCDGDREADDRFGEFGHADPENSVHATQDKDMRMVPGYHLDWKTHRMFYLEPGVYDATFNDLQYGVKWFWLQMLHGDTADFIPGLPRAYGKLCGEVTAGKLLSATTNNAEAFGVVADAYQAHYAEDWRTHMLEQACLLWMRRGPKAHWADCLQYGGPMNPLVDYDEGGAYSRAFDAIEQRIKQAQEINALSAETV